MSSHRRGGSLKRVIAVSVFVTGATGFVPGVSHLLQQQPRPVIPADPETYHQHQHRNGGGRGAVRLFGKVKKGMMKKELAGLSKPKDDIAEMTAGAKKKGGGKKKKKTKKGAEAAGSVEEDEDEDEEEDEAAAGAGGGGGGGGGGDNVYGGGGPVTLETELPPEVAAGRRVLDPMTKRPLFLPEATSSNNQEQARMAVCFPRPDAALRRESRLSWSPATGYKEVLAALVAASKGGNETMRSLVLANHDQLGVKAALLLTGCKMNAQYRRAENERAELEEARKLYLLAEATLNAPFRQLTKEAELRLGPVVGDDKMLQRMAKQLSPSDASAAWVLIKAAVATWEDKYIFDQLTEQRLTAAAQTVEGQAVADMQNKLGAARSSVKQTLENVKVWQGMCEAFLAEPSVAGKLRPELLFLEQALPLASEAEVRQLAATVFCAPGGAGYDPLRKSRREILELGEEEAAPGKEDESEMALAELRERVLLLKSMTPRLNPVNYGALATKIEEVSDALCRGSDEFDVEYYRRARAAGACDYETYNMPKTPFSALREWEQSSMVDEKRRLDALPLPDRPEGGTGAGRMDWFHEPLMEADGPEFQRISADDPDFVDDPEQWDSTVAVRQWQDEARSALKAAGKKKTALPPLREEGGDNANNAVPFPGSGAEEEEGAAFAKAFADFEALVEEDELGLFGKFLDLASPDEKELESFLDSLE